MEYKGYKVGDIVFYGNGRDPALGVITKITKRVITINWEWAAYHTGLDDLVYDDFDALATDFVKMTEQEKLAFLIRES